jgi:hypothetical protein
MRWTAIPLLTCIATIAFAQAPAATTGVVRGSVFDRSKAQIPGVRIILSNPEGEKARVNTNERGEYALEAPAGSYVLTAELPGFDTAITVAELKQTETLQLDVTMSMKPRLPRLVDTLKRSGPAASGFNGKWSSQSYQAEFNVVGDKVSGTLSRGGLGGDFHVITDGKLAGNQFRFQTKATGSTVDSQTGRRITSTATTTWFAQLVDETMIELRSELEIDNGVFAGPAR